MAYIDDLESLIKSKTWWVGEAPCVFQTAYPFMVGYTRLHRYFPKYYSSALLFLENNYAWQYLDEIESVDVGRMLFESYGSNSQTIEDKRLDWQKKYNQFKESCSEVFPLKLEELDNNKLAEYYEKFMELFVETWSISLIFEGTSFYTERFLLPNFKKKYKIPDDKSSHMLSVLTQPLQPSFLNIERELFLKLVVSKNEERKKLLDGYFNKYYWFRSSYKKRPNWNKPDISDAIEAEVKSRSSKEIVQEIKNLDDQKIKIKSEQTKIIEELGISNSDLQNIKLLQLLGEWQDTRKEMTTFGNYHLFLLLESVSKRLNLSLDLINYADPKEITQALKGKTLDKEELKDRSKFMLFVTNSEEQEFILSSSEALKMKKVIEKSSEEEFATLKGVTASLGNSERLEGEVTVVFDPDDTEFVPGNILVTPMTRPEFVPLMRHASAVITDQGGITSHAAIVSRELNIPCVVGTKIATKVLKSGDKVTVDVKQGVITKLI